MQLAANWPDKQPGCPVSPLIVLEPRAIGQQGGTLYESDRERLSEETLQIGWVKKRSDSPNPEQILRAIQLWKEGIVWKIISVEVGVPERTLRRQLKQLRYKRDYSFVSKKLSGRKLTVQHKMNLSNARKIKGSARGEKNPNWKGGLNNPKVPIWNTSEYKIWREFVFKRDNYSCKGCSIRNRKGLGKTVVLEAHHILPRRDFPHLTFDLSNGITLCKSCHDKTRKKEYLSVNIWKQRV